jgi:transcriptional regulator with XRE-family HTH domain
MPTFAERLRELREAAGLTQSGLAEVSGLPLGSIRNYEQGQREPYWQVVFRLAKAVGVSCEAFAECVDGATSPPPTKRRRAAPAAPKRPRGRPRKAK